MPTTTPTTQTPDEVIAAFITRLMHGETVPPSESAACAELAEALRGIYARRSDRELALVALRVMDAMIDMVRSSVQAESVLRDFIRGGGR
jgi:hypothetical protein